MHIFCNKEKVYKAIEQLIKDSFEDDSPNPGEPDFKFKNEYLVRSKKYWSINHFLDYVKNTIDKV